MSDNLELKLSAKDGITPVVAAASKSLTGLGTTAQAAGKTASQGFRGVKTEAADLSKGLGVVQRESAETSAAMQKMGQAAGRADQDLDRLDSSAKKSGQGFTELGAAAGAAVSGLALIGRAGETQARQVDAIGRAYGDAGDDVLEFAQQVEDASNFTDEAARQSLISVQGLTRQYGISQEQIEGLITRSADLAQINGIDLADAVSRTSGALRGEGEAAEALGLNLSDAAVAAAAAAAGLTGWNTTMTEAEKAAFRYNLLMEQSAFATGAAADAAKGATGFAYDLVAGLQDAAVAADGFLGPIDEMAAPLAEVAIALPVVGAGLGKMVGGAKEAAAAMTALRASSALASVALGPVGLALAGTAAVVALGAATDWFGLAGDGADEYAEAVKLADGATQALNDTLYAMRNADPGTFFNVQDLNADLESAVSWATKYADAYQTILDFEGTGLGNRDDLLANRIGADPDTVRQVGLTTEGVKELGRVTNELAGRLDDTGVNSRQLYADMDGLFTQLQNGDITAQQLLDALLGLEAGFNDTYLTINRTTEAVGGLTGAIREFLGIDVGQFDLDIFLRNIGAAQRAAADDQGLAETIFGWGEAAGAAGAEVNELTEAQVRLANSGLGDALKGQASAARETQAAFDQGLTVALGSARDAMAAYRAEVALQIDAAQELAFSQENVLTTIEAMSSAPSAGLSFAQDFDQAAQSLARSSELIIGTIGQLRGATSDVAGFASGLTGVSLDGGVLTRELAAADELLESGAIGWNSYRAAVESTEQILLANARAQSALNEIGVDQIPLLERQTSAYADYLESIANMPREQQQLQLAYANTAYTGQLATDAALLSSAAMGELGENGRQAAASIVAAHAEADPALRALYEDAKLITTMEDGTIRVNFPDGQSLTQEVGELTDAITLLTTVIAEANGIEIDIPYNDKAAGFLDALNSKLGDTESHLANLARGGGGGLGGFLGNLSGAFQNQGQTGPPDMPSFTGSTGDMGLGAGSGLPTGPIIIPVTVDTQSGQANVVEMRGILEDLAGETFTTELGANAQGAYQVIRNVEGDIVAVVQGNYVVKVDGDGTDAHNDIESVDQALGALNGTSATVTAYANSEPAMSELARLLGYQGDAYINVYSRSIPTTQVAGGFYRDGGVVPMPSIPEARHGIVMNNLSPVRMHEVGGEDVLLPGASMVIPAPASRMAAERRSSRQVVVNVNIYAPIYGVDDLQRTIRDAIMASHLSGSR